MFGLVSIWTKVALAILGSPFLALWLLLLQRWPVYATVGQWFAFAVIGAIGAYLWFPLVVHVLYRSHYAALADWRRFPLDPLPRFVRWTVLFRSESAILAQVARRAYAAGDSETLADAARRLLVCLAAHPSERDGLSGDDDTVVNTAIWAGTSSGQYRSVVEASDTWLPSVVAIDRIRSLFEINVAEAEFNLGEWSAAWARIEALDPSTFGAVARAGHAMTGAWILAHAGLGEDAVALAESAPPHWLPVDYRAEAHYSRCAAYLTHGRPAEALASVDEGLAIVHRPSSERNGWFLKARVLESLGDRRGALAICEKAAGHRFKGQGGDGLLFWGQLLADSGDVEAARRAWTLAVERDPESESAVEARENLLSLAGAVTDRARP